MPGKIDIEALRRGITDREIDTVLVAMVDMQGRMVGKRVTGHFFLESVMDAMHVCDYLLTVDMEMEPIPGFKFASWDLGYGDLSVRPDLNTLRRIPWLPGTALVLGDAIDHHGNEIPVSPRTILKQQIRRLQSMGYTAKIGSELEFYAFDDSFDAARQKEYRDLKTTGWYIEDYHLFQTTKVEPLMRTIRNSMDEADIPVEFSKGEWGPGQSEINVRYAEALEMADRHTIFKNGVKEIAFLQGKATTFMAKWREDLAGSSCHVHTSLWSHDVDEPLCADSALEYGFSKIFRSFLAGQLALAPDMTYFLAPFVNSYKRFQSGTFAPTKAVWSRDNRTAGFRMVGAGPSLRAECRIPGADVNPYLAFAALLAGGVHGVESSLELMPAYEGNAYEATHLRDVPTSLREALEALDDSRALRDAFGDEVIDHYVHAGRWEQAEFERRVTDWERIRYFERA